MYFDLLQKKKETSSKDSESQNSYASTQESQLSATDPVYPELMDCDASVDQILPQLTSSVW